RLLGDATGSVALPKEDQPKKTNECHILQREVYPALNSEVAYPAISSLYITDRLLKMPIYGTCITARPTTSVVLAGSASRTQPRKYGEKRSRFVMLRRPPPPRRRRPGRLHFM